ncbi:MAG: chitobiase/beta-hexosaminidase C-terminal domain-containing protein [Vicinamibacterales bacterium]
MSSDRTRIPLVVLVCLFASASPGQTQSLVVNGVSSGTVSANAGSVVTVEVSGSSAALDWVALAPAGGSYIAWLYMNGTQSAPSSAIPSATLTFPLPFQIGDFEIRLYANNSYTVLATRTVSVGWPTNSSIVVEGLSPPDTVVALPGHAVTVDVAHGAGSPTDWVGLYRVGTQSYTSWQYLNGTGTPPASGVFSASLTFPLPLEQARYELRFYAHDSYALLATSTLVVVETPVVVSGQRPPVPLVVPPLATIAVSVMDGPAYPTDWLGLRRIVQGHPLVSWKYLNGSHTAPATGVSASTVEFQLPDGPGQYAVEFSPNDTYTVIGTSPTVTASCVSSVSRGSIAATSAGTTGSMSVVAPSGCGWTAESPSSFVHVTSGASGVGTGTMTFSVDSNASSDPLTGALTIGGYLVPVGQDGSGFDSTACELSLSATVTDPQSGTLNITGPSDCAWTVASGSSQVTVGQGSGTGPATVAYQLDAAWAPTSISGLSIGGLPTAVQSSASTGPICLQVPIIRLDNQVPIQWIQLCAYPTGQSSSPLDPPVATPPGGTYAQAQSVTLTAAAGATIRYTLDGQTPSAASPAYTTPLSIAATTTLKAGAFDQTGTPSATLTETYEIVPPPPVCAYTVAVSPETFPAAGGSGELSVTAPPACPWTAETAASWITFVGTVTGVGSGTVSYTASANEGDARSSSITLGYVSQDVHQLGTSADTVPPTIQATATPAANGFGWHFTDVRVVFSCSDALSGVVQCPGPVTVVGEGVDLLASGTALDAAGNSASASATFKIDRTAPVVTILSPEDRATASGSLVQVHAEVSDALSGVASAWCNGVEASIDNGQVTCDVSVRPGLNAVIVNVVDQAGNSGSAGVHVKVTGTPTTLLASPSHLTMLTQRVQPVSITSEFGVELSGVEWSSADPTVATVLETDGFLVEAHSEGSTVLTASWESLTTTVTVTVLGGTSLPTGTPVWSTAAAPGMGLQELFYTHKEDPSTPDFFAVEADATWTNVVARGLMADGRPGEVLPLGGGYPVMGDALGGLIVGTVDGALARVGGPAGTLPWRHRFTDNVWPDGAAGIAQSPNGRIYFVETLSDGGTPLAKHVVVLDGHTGQTLERIPLPTGSATINGSEGCWSTQWSTYETMSEVGKLAVNTDGDVYLPFDLQSGVEGCGAVPHVNNTAAYLLKMGAQGGSSTITLASMVAGDHSGVGVGQVVPDGEGGVTAFGVRSHDGASQVQHLLFHHAGGASAGAVEIETTATEPSAGVVGADKLLFTADGYIDLITGTVTAFSPTTGGLVVPLAEGGVTEIELPVSDPVQVAFGGWAGMANGAAAVFQGLELNEFPLTFRLGLGNAQRQQAPRMPYGTVDRAAIAVLRFYNPRSIEENREYGGSICRAATGGYLGNVPNLGVAFSDSVVPTPCEPNQLRGGRYHTHGRDGNDGFSSVDISNADADSVGGAWIPSYVATPCGRIYKYKGPNFAVHAQFPEKTDTSRTCNP